MSMQYTQRMKQRVPELKKGWGQIAIPLSEALEGGGQSVPALGLQFDSPGGRQTMLRANKTDFTEYK